MKANLEEILKEDLGTSYFSKDLDQESEEYNLIKSYIEIYDLQHEILGTLFSTSEIKESEILMFNGAAPFSYPEPRGSIFSDAIYQQVCPDCGSFGDQVHDFVIKRDPAFKSNKLASLHWVTDELFCHPDLYNVFFKHLSLQFRPVRLLKGNQIANSVVQIVLPMLNDPLNLKELQNWNCHHCKRVKYIPTINGFFPLPKERNFDLIKTREFFGTGNSSGHRILVNRKVMNEMIGLKMAKLHQFVPCR